MFGEANKKPFILRLSEEKIDFEDQWFVITTIFNARQYSSWNFATNDIN